jgi:HemY protein
MRFLIFIFLALSAGIGLTMLADNPGYVLISRQPWSFESSLMVFILGLLAIFVLFYLLLRLLDNLLSSPARLRRWQAQRNRNQATEDTRKGITEMIIGHLPQAEKFLTRRLADSPQPEINLLGAAWVAQQTSNQEKRDDYISEATTLAASAVDGSLTAVGLVQCQLQQQAEEIEQALGTMHCQKKNCRLYSRRQQPGCWQPVARRLKPTKTGKCCRKNFENKQTSLPHTAVPWQSQAGTRKLKP